MPVVSIMACLIQALNNLPDVLAQCSGTCKGLENELANNKTKTVSNNILLNKVR